MKHAAAAVIALLSIAVLIGAAPDALAPLRAAPAAAPAAALILGGALGIGGRLRLGRAAALAAGLGLLGGIGVVALAVGAPPGPGVAAAAAVGWVLSLRRIWEARAAPIASWTAAAVVLVLCAPTALAPPTDTDALYQHLGLAARMMHEGALVGGPLSPDASRPLLLVGLWAALLDLGGPQAAALVHLGIAAALVVAVGVRGQRILGPAGAALGPVLLAGSWTVLAEAPIVGNNLPAALGLFAAAGAAAGGARMRAGLLLGIALSWKYTAALGAPLVLASAPGLGAAAVVGLTAALCVAPWPVRNLIDGLHPLFPYAGWEFSGRSLPFVHLEKYGAGRAPADWLALPWRVLMDAERDSFRFLGRLHPGLGPTTALALVGRGGAVGAIRGIGVLAGVVGWAAGPQWLRHLLPLLPLIIVQGMEGIATLGSTAPRRQLAAAALAGLVALGIPHNLWPAAAMHAQRIPAALDASAAEDLRRAEVPGAAVTAWANTHLPEHAVVGLVRSWDLLGIARRSRLGSVEDHTPLRALLWTDPAHPFAALRAAGVTHLLVGPPAFLPAAYPFLSRREYGQLYEQPEALLEQALLHEATLIYAHEGSAVYILDSARH